MGVSLPGGSVDRCKFHADGSPFFLILPSGICTCKLKQPHRFTAFYYFLLTQKTLSATNLRSVPRVFPSLFHILFYTILLPFAVILNFAPSISHARRHMSMRCKKISKYSSMEQMFSSIFKFRVITFFSSFTFNFASVTA